MNDVIVSGLETKHRSYASVSSARTNNEDSEHEQQTLEEQVVAFLSVKDCPLTAMT